MNATVPNNGRPALAGRVRHPVNKDLRELMMISSINKALSVISVIP
jgi:hypothetical protein